MCIAIVPKCEWVLYVHCKCVKLRVCVFLCITSVLNCVCVFFGDIASVSNCMFFVHYKCVKLRVCIFFVDCKCVKLCVCVFFVHCKCVKRRVCFLCLTSVSNYVCVCVFVGFKCFKLCVCCLFIARVPNLLSDVREVYGDIM